ncbi:hypothetical protein [Nocardioides sp.]|uniref:hypothetical protein n=1 Tax=Nocardioides sp. TaxID=35761 RepID=UPI0039E29F9F
MRRLPLATPAALLFGLLGHSYALVVLLTSLDRVRSAPGDLAVFALSLSLVAGTVLLARPAGTLTTPRLALLGTGLVAVDLANALLIDPDRWSEAALWAVGTGSVTTLALALMAPVRLVLLVLAAHAVTLLACLALLPTGDNLARAGLTVVDSMMIPLLGMRGANLYAKALADRARALDRTEATEQAMAAAADAERAALEELSWLTDQVVRPLTTVAEGGSLTAADRALLELTATRLRRELTAGAGRPGLAELLPRRTAVDVDVVDPDGLGHRFRQPDRAALGGLLRLLGDADDPEAAPGWARAVLTASAGSALVTLYAEGTPATVLAGEQARTLLGQLGGPAPEPQGDGVLVEVVVPLR